jgi:hypothetical protein
MQQQQQQQRTVDKQFTHMLVSDAGAMQETLGRVQYAGYAYMIGTLQQCRVGQMQMGLRATTRIIPF